MFKNSIFTILVTVIAICVNAAQADEPAGSDLTGLDNSDITWIGSFVGIGPKMSERSQSRLRLVTKKDIPTLIKLTEDPRRFAVAHVILAEVFQNELEIHTDSFFGLTIANDGKVSTYPNYKPQVLKAYWQKVAVDHKGRVAAFEEEMKQAAAKSKQ